MISIVIISYNYAEYLPAAVESALGQTLLCQVIVVDDGSTDNSIEAIAPYRNKIELIEKENGGEASAMWEGFRRAKFDTVIFLDSDDMLYPTCAETVLHWIRPDVSKIQYRLDTVDAAGRNLDAPFPFYPRNITPDRIFDMVVRSGKYPSPVNTGIAYSRSFLSRVMPVNDTRFRNNGDGYLTILAPLYGQVISLPIMLGAYRVHGRNFWVNNDRSRVCSAYARHELDRQEVFEAHARALQVTVPKEAVLNNTSHLEHRMLSLRFTPDSHPASHDTRTALFIRGVRRIVRSVDLTMTGRIVWVGYLSVLSYAPKRFLRPILSQARGPGGRARWARTLVAWSRAGMER